MEGLANGGWSFFVMEQDLSQENQGLLIRIVGTTDPDATLFPRWGGLVIQPPVQGFLVAKKGGSGLPTILQTIITEAMDEQKAAMGAFAARSSPFCTRDAIKKSSLVSVLDINRDTQLMATKEGGASKVERVAGLIREWDKDRMDHFLPNRHFVVSDMQARLLRQSERQMVVGSPFASLSRLSVLTLTEAWTNPIKFERWCLSLVRGADFSESLWDFISPDSSAWGRDTFQLGRHNLLEAVVCWGEFQCIIKGAAFKGCVNSIRDLWEDPEIHLEHYQSTFIHCQLEVMIREYCEELTTTFGKVSKLTVGLPLGGQQESVALLKANVDKFVALFRGGLLEKTPHVSFYESDAFLRIQNKPEWRVRS